jgi:serine/threonine protein kinase
MDMDIGDGIHRDIQGDGIEVFTDLLGKLLKYIPKDRLTANAAQDHEWFQM